ncbi:MAG: hypothetical protein ACXVGT_17345 [Oryzihumus sp.]
MAVRIDTDRIRARAAQQACREGSSVDLWIVLGDLWVVLGDLDRRGAASAVRTAVAQVEGRTEHSWTVYPTSGGVFTALHDARNWVKAVSALSRVLEEAGHEVVVTTPPRAIRDVPRLHLPQPTALLGHRLDPPISTGPFNEWDMPAYRWGAPARATTALLDRAAEWIALPGTQSQIFTVPVTAEDAPELFKEMLQDRDQHTPLVCLADEGSRLRRSVTLDTWGQSAWNDVDPTGRRQPLPRT